MIYPSLLSFEQRVAFDSLAPERKCMAINYHSARCASLRSIFLMQEIPQWGISCIKKTRNLHQETKIIRGSTLIKISVILTSSLHALTPATCQTTCNRLTSSPMHFNTVSSYPVLSIHRTLCLTICIYSSVLCLFVIELTRISICLKSIFVNENVLEIHAFPYKTLLRLTTTTAARTIPSHIRNIHTGTVNVFQ